MTQITYKTEISRTRRWAGIAWLFICGLTAAYFFAKGATVEPQSSPQVSLASESAAAPQAGAWRLKPIEQVKSGERVWAYDPKTQLWSPREVVRPLEHDYAGDLITLTVQGRSLEATGNHPFWVAAGSNLSDRPAARDVPEAERAAASSLSGRWVEARSLLPGDLLVVRSGQMATVEEIATRRTEQKVYNLQVADLHTYAVGELGIAVHNKAMQIAPVGRALPELVIDGQKYPELAQNIWHAQEAGHPDVLTAGGNRVANRTDALRDVPRIPALSRDEYPFASAREGGEGSWVGHIPPAQQHAQGGLIKNFIDRNRLQPGDQYRVRVINYP